MKTIIAGSRGVSDQETVNKAIESSGFPITEVVSGGCSGPDTLGENYARANNIPIKRFWPDWNKYGRAAGPIRNSQMASYAEALIAIWDGQSRGTKNMIEEAWNKGLKVFVYNTSEVGK